MASRPQASQRFQSTILKVLDPEASDAGDAFPMLKKILFSNIDERASLEDLEAAFKELDKDDSGSIEVEEIVEAFQACGLGATLAATTIIFQEIDRDMSGSVDLYEFADFISSIEEFDSWEREYNSKSTCCKCCLRFTFVSHLTLTFVVLIAFVRMSPPDPEEGADVAAYDFARNIVYACLSVLFLLLACVVLWPVLRLWCDPCVRWFYADAPRPSSPSARLSARLSERYGVDIPADKPLQPQAFKGKKKKKRPQPTTARKPLPSGGSAQEASAVKPPKGVRHVGRLVLQDFDADPPPPPSDAAARLDVESAPSTKSVASSASSERWWAPRWSRVRTREPETQAAVARAPSEIAVPRWSVARGAAPRWSLWRRPTTPVGGDPSDYAAAAAAQEKEMLRAAARTGFNPLHAPRRAFQPASEVHASGPPGAVDTVVVISDAFRLRQKELTGSKPTLQTSGMVAVDVE